MKPNLIAIGLLILSTVASGEAPKVETRTPRLSRDIQYSTVRIESHHGDQVGVGTGFFFNFLVNSNRSVPAIVTCKHVIEEAESGQILITVANPSNTTEKTFVPIHFTAFRKLWFTHPDTNVDLAIMPIATILDTLQSNVVVYIYPFNLSFVPTDPDLIDYGPLQPIAIVGYPIGIWDEVHNLPIVRRGVTATDPNDDYNGKKEFLIDAACFPGSSGSPVLICDEGFFTSKGAPMAGSRLSFLGILYGGHEYSAEGTIVAVQIPTGLESRSRTSLPANLGSVIKASRLREFEPLLEQLAKERGE